MSSAMSLLDSPFAHRLDTNYVPSDSDILKIQALLVEPEHELALLDAQIDELETTLSELREKRASLKAPIDAHRALTSPIRRIPHDVLLEIFFSCLPLTNNALIDASEAPLLLGLICRHWRNVAYTTPRIWSSIHIPSLNYHDLPPKIMLALDKVVEAWLERSGVCPLSVSFTESFTEHMDPSDPALNQPSPISQLLAASRRLCRLELTASARALQPILNLGPDALPLLRSMGIRTSGNKLFSEFSMNALNAPGLQEISLSVSGDPLSFPLRWPQLTRLNLVCFPAWTDQGTEGGVDANVALEVLRRCPNLSWCQIQINKPDPVHDNTSVVTMPYLHTFILGSPFSLPHCILHLVLPKLSYLRIESMSSRRRRRRIQSGLGPSIFDDANWSGNNPSSCLKIDIDPSRFPLSSLVDVLQRFPGVTHLQLLSITVHETLFLDDSFLALLSSTGNVSCSSLTHLSVNAPCARFSDIAVLAFIKARVELASPLQQLKIQFGRSADVDIIPDLQSFISDGLQLCLQYSAPKWKFDPQEGLFSGPESY
ncbi:hypothetical protein C8F04DRAFT_1102085 [Mycena alexandri]|uniref:F-box domain-containing protein n=1 Tax=Mycena alexandri TaxID=1745969 RepID=A0AAD6SUW2_9AGAR|nr:hypothetical protein C8F04DRAFT_1102085 [Mycena alexandri]